MEAVGRLRGSLVGAVVLAATCAFLAVGSVGLVRYLRGYWLYRGFPPPQDPAFVQQQGTTEKLAIPSPALGGRSQEVDVYLPPGYDPSKRYPVFYLLHGFPGRPTAFLFTVRAGVVEDILVSKGAARPAILVMPFGSTGTFTDEEWANGVRAGNGWETFVARDLVRAVDARYSTIRSAAGRAIGGLSEGGYGAINIALHHPGEFHVVESWSGYERAAPIASIFGKSASALAYNSPLEELPRVARELRRRHVYFWFYSGSKDRLWKQNLAFSHELAVDRIRHKFFTVRGGHNWALWRGNAAPALLAASRRLARG